MLRQSKSIVFLGASGAVGSEALNTVLSFSEIDKIMLLGRRKGKHTLSDKLTEHIINISDSRTYEEYIKGFDTAICTLGVGEPSKKSLFLRTKGELIVALKALHFDRLSIFQPSMILTPTNRYGLSQAIVLKLWPKLDFILQGNARKYGGIKVAELGKAIANNSLTKGVGTEYLQYDDFKQLVK